MAVYDRTAAVRYVQDWWHRFHPNYPALADDCTSFISQALRAGGWPLAWEKQRQRGWWYRHKQNGWSFSWTVANALRQFWLAADRGREVADATGLRPGDIIFYDWNGDGRFRHSAMVIGLDPTGAPLMGAHTAPALGVRWAYTHSPAWSPETGYSFVKITDQI